VWGGHAFLDEKETKGMFENPKIAAQAEAVIRTGKKTEAQKLLEPYIQANLQRD
jgi:hypothetical protein